MVETTSYIQIFKKNKKMSPQFTVETTATSWFFQNTSQNKKGIDHHGRNYKLHPDFQKEEENKSKINGRNYGPKYEKSWTAMVQTTNSIQIV